MCLHVNQAETDKLRQSGEEFVIRYKVVRILKRPIERPDNYANFFPPETYKLVSIYYAHSWVRGINRADYHYPYAWEQWENRIYCGIHVFINKEDAEAFAKSYFESINRFSGGSTLFKSNKSVTILPVKCYIKDLIAVGYWDDIETEAYREVTWESEVCA